MMQETTPLLGDEGQRQRPPITGSIFQAKSAKSICLVISVFTLLLMFSSSVGDVPTTRLVEDHICRSYYAEQGRTTDDIDESMCKVDEVQSKMAYLNGWISMIKSVLGMMYISILAERR